MGKKVDDAQAQYSAAYARVQVTTAELKAREDSLHGAKKDQKEATEKYTEAEQALHHAIEWEAANPEPVEPEAAHA